MKRIHRIIPSPSAPELILEGGIAEKLVGESVAPLSPDEPFIGHLKRVEAWNQFYRVGTNAFALSEDAWEHCEPMYYALCENSIEFPSVANRNGDFRIIHPLQFLPPSDNPSQVCDLTYAGTIFRMQGRPPEEVFCLEGIAVPNDEIKRAYEIYGFKGLIFEEVWSGE